MSDDSESGTGLPVSFEIAWGVRQRPTKGPRRGLSLERIVAAGVAVASAEGLGAVSMSRVASELGTSAMALYRYVATKNELLALMVDAALGGTPQVVGDDGWRPSLERWAWAELAAYRRHPWVLQVPVSGPPVTPNQIAFMEQGLRCMRDTGLLPAEKLSMILTISSYTRSWASLSAEIAAAVSAGDTTAVAAMTQYGRTLAALTDPADFPALHEVIEAEVFEAEEVPDEEFVFGLERLLDGLEVLIRSRR